MSNKDKAKRIAALIGAAIGAAAGAAKPLGKHDDIVGHTVANEVPAEYLVIDAEPSLSEERILGQKSSISILQKTGGIAKNVVDILDAVVGERRVKKREKEDQEGLNYAARGGSPAMGITPERILNRTFQTLFGVSC